MKHKPWLLFFTGSLLFLLACSRTADVELKPHKSLLVLHGYVAVGDTFKVSLGRSFSANTQVADTASFVRNGWVLLYEENNFLDTLKYNEQERRYVSASKKAQSGKRYRVVAGADGFDNVEASATAPQQVPTLSLMHQRNARTTSEGVLLDDITFRFSDPAGEPDYYLATLYPGYPDMKYLCVYTYDPSVERYTGGLAPFDPGSCISNDELLINDRSFNGLVKDITISSDALALANYTDPFSGKTYRPYLKRYVISGEYYQYFKKVLSLGYDAGTPTLSDPIIIKGNVTNGYGLFTLYTVTTDSLP